MWGSMYVKHVRPSRHVHGRWGSFGPIDVQGHYLNTHGDHLWWAGFVGELVLHAVGLHPFILYAAAVAFWQLGNWTAFTE